MKEASPLSSNAEPAFLPVLRPRLPSAEAILPYLQRIDRQRTYSNWGPLVQELGERLCAAFALPKHCVVLANSGMSALMGGILATAGCARGTRRLALVPDFTFAATALAVEMCGYEPVIVPCGRQSWSFSPEDVLRAPADLLDQVGLVVPVAPFGRVVSQSAWIRFRKDTSIPVVIDAAACFEALVNGSSDVTGEIPIALSFHATKSFGIGEGGCVVGGGVSTVERAIQALNFGFSGSRDAAVASFNGKMSEYAAAIGLAELDGWKEKSNAYLGVTNRYRAALGNLGHGRRMWGSPQISSSYILMECASASEATGLMLALQKQSIDTRLWYGMGIGQQSHFKRARRLDAPQEGALDPAVLVGLPVAPDLAPQDVERVCSAIHAALG